MSASVNDKITDTRNSARPVSTTVSSSRSPGGTTLACASLTGWATASKVHFVTYQIDSNSDVVAGTQLDCYGIVSGNNINSLTVVDGTDNGNSVGDIVEMLPTAAWGQDLADALTEEHNRDGTHSAVTADSVSTDTITEGTADTGVTIDGLNIKDSKLVTANSVVTANITDAAVTPAKRSGGFKVGNFTVTGSTTGNQSVTGVGFTPKEVQFFLLQDQSAPTINDYSYGAMDDSGNQWTHWGITVEGGDASASYSTSACLSSPSTNASVRLSAAYVSMDVDGFTFNKTSNGTGNKIIGYIARG